MAVTTTGAERSLLASAAAHVRWSREDPKPALAKVREGRQRRLEDQVDPDRTLPEDERQRRVQSALKAEMQLLALKSARARRLRAARKAGDAA